MVKHIQKYRRQIADELFECVWPFCEVAAKRVKAYLMISKEIFIFLKGFFITCTHFFDSFI